jgi:23S rRNA pseudouridine2605 synthase
VTVPPARAMGKLCSRREAIALIISGRIRVEGRRVTDPGDPVIPERPRIAVDGAAAPAARLTTLALHKPRGVRRGAIRRAGRPSTDFSAI